MFFFDNNTDGAMHDPNLVFTLSRVFNNNPCKSDRTYKLLGVDLDEHLDLNTTTLQITYLEPCSSSGGLKTKSHALHSKRYYSIDICFAALIS
jgi:hypothetical protein